MQQASTTHLAGSVPNLQSYSLTVDVHVANAENDAERGKVIVPKRAIGKTRQQTRLADTWARNSGNMAIWSTEGTHLTHEKMTAKNNICSTELTRVANHDKLDRAIVVALLRFGHDCH